MGLVWGLGGFDGFDTFFFSLYKALRYVLTIVGNYHSSLGNYHTLVVYIRQLSTIKVSRHHNSQVMSPGHHTI